MRSRTVAWALAIAAAVAVTGCGPVSRAASSTGSASASLAAVSPNARSLLSRPIKLPAVPAGSPCPVTATANVSVGIGNPRGHGPFYLGGGLPKGGYPFNKMVYVTIGSASGPVLLRGGRIDGAGRLKFSGNRADPVEKGETLSTSSGSWTFYQAVIGDTDEALYVFPSTGGCYAVQVDGPNFQDVITISAS